MVSSRSTTWARMLKQHWLFAVIFVALGVLFWNLLFTHYLMPQADGLYSAGSTWSDLNGHMGMIMNFAEHGLISTLHNNPLYAGVSVSYPFVPNYLSALLVMLGMSL